MELIESLTKKEKEIVAALTEEEIEKVALENLKNSLQKNVVTAESYFKEYLKTKELYYNIREACKNKAKEPKTLILIKGKPTHK